MESWHKALGGRSVCEPLSADAEDTYGGRVPDELLAEWREWGFCSYGDGLLWFVNPAEFEEIAGLWMDRTPQPAVIARSAFGDLVFWDELQGALYMDVVYDNVHELAPDFDELTGKVFSGEDFRNDLLRQPLFEEAKARLGVLAADEVYAFEPAPSLGGPGTADTLQKAKLKEYLALLASFR